MDVRRVSNKLKDLHKSLEGKRQTHDWHWQEIADYNLPAREFTRQRVAGEKRMQKVYDSTPIYALWAAASGLDGLLTSSSIPWFSLDTEDEDKNDSDEVKLWLEDATQRMYSLLGNSAVNFNNAKGEAYLDLLAFGTGVIVREKKNDAIRFKSVPLGECYIDEGAEGLVNTLIRKPRNTTAKFLVETFGADNVSKQVMDIYKRDPFSAVSYLHCVYPRDVFDISVKNAKNMPFASIYMEYETGHILREGGFRDFPYIVPRLTKQSGEIYGTGRGALALPDVKMLNLIMQSTIEAAQLSVRPPVMAPDDGFLEPIRMAPNSINYYRAGTSDTDRITAINLGNNPKIGLDIIDSVRESIRKAYFNDVFLLRDGVARSTEMSATEAIELRNEKMTMLGAIGARLENEFLAPVIDITFSAMMEAGMFAPPPAELSGANLKIRYLSPMAKSQRKVEVNGINSTLAFIMQAAQIDPSVAASMNLDEAIRRVAYLTNTPLAALRTRKEVQQMQQQQQQQQQMANEAQMAQQMAGALQSGGAGIKSLAEIGAAGRA